jgi:copper homeostasis protein
VNKERLIIEVCANGISSALNAQRGGADRIELCDFIEAGGITPTFDVISVVKEKLVIPVHVLIRPRPGNFRYRYSEFRTMHNEIAACREFGVDGVVFGILNEQNEVEIARCRALVKAAGNMSVTFHRAFDKVRNPFAALRQIIDLGFDRILTSGQKDNCLQGCELIAQLSEEAKAQIIMMPGGGIHEDNIEAIVQQSRAHEFHFSAKMKQADGTFVSDEQRIRKIKTLAVTTFYGQSIQ